MAVVMWAEDVTAVIVTRGNVPLDESMATLPFKVIIWDNSQGEDLGVYGRYQACRDVMTPLVYFQDDDCVVEDPMAIVAAHEPGHVVCNMPQEFRHDFYADHALVGFGAVCEPWLPKRAFKQFREPIPGRPLRLRPVTGSPTCDVIFTALTPRILADVPVRNLPWATGPDRMYRQEGHVGERAETLRLALQVRDA
jgi:hypothetical protein